MHISTPSSRQAHLVKQQGLVWVTIIGQVPKLFGIQGGDGDFFEKLWQVLGKLPDADMTTSIVGLASLARTESSLA